MNMCFFIYLFFIAFAFFRVALYEDKLFYSSVFSVMSHSHIYYIMKTIYNHPCHLSPFYPCLP